MTETVGALWQMGSALWRLEWWQAGAILLEYKLSFFLFGLLAGVVVALVVVFQVIETLLDLMVKGVSALFD
ncbi:MAG: hypothetical protein ACOYNY_07375 [Caldilineaceae bacterium]